MKFVRNLQVEKTLDDTFGGGPYVAYTARSNGWNYLVLEDKKGWWSGTACKGDPGTEDTVYLGGKSSVWRTRAIVEKMCKDHRKEMKDERQET